MKQVATILAGMMLVFVGWFVWTLSGHVWADYKAEMAKLEASPSPTPPAPSPSPTVVTTDQELQLTQPGEFRGCMDGQIIFVPSQSRMVVCNNPSPQPSPHMPRTWFCSWWRKADFQSRAAVCSNTGRETCDPC